jgi:hypothetical protein
MKLVGGEWSRGDLLALLGVLVAIGGLLIATLTIPGMPKVFHWDAESSVKQPVAASAVPKTETPAPAPVRKTRDVTSGQVNFGCDQSLPVETPAIYFGKNPRDIDSRVAWANTDNVKMQNQALVKVEVSPDHPSGGMKGVGTIAGRDSQNILGVRNCPGGGHGELTLHVVWIEDE